MPQNFEKMIISGFIYNFLLYCKCIINWCAINRLFPIYKLKISTSNFVEAVEVTFKSTYCFIEFFLKL